MEFAEFVEIEGTQVRLGAGRHLFRQGDTDRSVYLVRSGLLKAYYLSDEGRESIKSFVLAGETIGSLIAAYSKNKCTFNLVALEESVLVALDFDALYEASRTDLQLAAAVIGFLLEFAMKKEKREREFLTESAESRYRRLVREAPELMERVKQKEIARYLGITPVALSRIRGRSAERS